MTTPDERAQLERFARVRRKRSLAIGLAIGALCLVFYAITIVKFGPAVLARPL